MNYATAAFLIPTTFVACLLATVLQGCTGTLSADKGQAQAERGLTSTIVQSAGLEEIATLTLLPPFFDKEAIVAKGGVTAESANELQQNLYTAFNEEVRYELTTVKEKKENSVIPHVYTERDLPSLLKDASSDAVLVTTVHTYQERVGSAVAASQPASLSLSFRVLRTRDGAELWNAVFGFRDKAIIDNLFDASSYNARGWQTLSGIVQDSVRVAAQSLERSRLESLQRAPRA